MQRLIRLALLLFPGLSMGAEPLFGKKLWSGISRKGDTPPIMFTALPLPIRIRFSHLQELGKRPRTTMGQRTSI